MLAETGDGVELPPVRTRVDGSHAHAGAQQRPGLGAMDGFEQLRIRRFALAFEIRHLAADHAAHRSRRRGQFRDHARLAIVGHAVHLRQRLKCQGEQRVAGENRHGFAEDFVRRQLAAAVIVVIERRQVVVDQRIGVDELE